jgi:hypothetical protein
MGVVIVHGEGGGVGKSTTATRFGEYVLAKSLPLVVVETDAAKPDVGRYFDGVVPVRKFNLRVQDGWFELLSMLEEEKTPDVVVSLPGGIGSEVLRYAKDLVAVSAELKRTVSVWWPMNRTPDSVTMLLPVMNAFEKTNVQLVAVRNLHFGESGKFVRWNESKPRKRFLSEGGLEVDLEELPERCVDATFCAIPPKRYSSNGESGLRYIERLWLSDWLEKTAAAFDAIAEKVGVGKW